MRRWSDKDLWQEIENEMWSQRHQDLGRSIHATRTAAQRYKTVLHDVV